jgi:hypothetical protein
MKSLYITILSLLIAGFAFGEQKTEKKLALGKVPSDKRPQVNPEKPSKPIRKPFPSHWGKPPEIQVRDIRPLPLGYGMGSSTLLHWILENVKKDRLDRPKRPEPSKEVKEKANAMRLLQNELNIARKALKEELRGKSKEDVASLIQSFKDSQKEKHQELKEAKKELAKEIRDKIQSKERRE